MSTRVPALALCGLLAGCGPAAAPPPADQATKTAASAPAPETKASAAVTVAGVPAASSPVPEPPLTQEEIDLIAADAATLSPEMRRKRAFALRRKIMQNPDSPTARQLEALRIAAEKGELQPQLPDSTSADKGLTLHARNPGPPAPTPPRNP